MPCFAENVSLISLLEEFYLVGMLLGWNLVDYRYVACRANKLLEWCLTIRLNDLLCWEFNSDWWLMLY